MKDSDKLIKTLNSLPLFAKNFLKIRTKSGRVEPFVFNRAQEYLHQRLEAQKEATGRVRAIVLKGRQQGCSTYVQARDFFIVSTRRGKKAFILTHEAEATKNLFDITKRYLDEMPAGLVPVPDTSSAKELKFNTLNSSYAVGTAGNKSVGRSQTIQLFHGCLAEGTKIIDPVSGGIRDIQSFNVGDKVLTHTGKIAPISYISAQEKECLSVVFRGLGKFPLLATKEHRFWTKKGWQELKDLSVSDSIGYPVKDITSDKSQLSLPPATVRSHGGGRQFICPDSIKIDYNLGRFVGLYLAEGHIKLQHKSPHNPCLIELSVHRKEVERTLDWIKPFKQYFSSVKTTDRDDCLTSSIILYGNRFAALINNLCGRTTSKHLPLEWNKMGNEFCRGLVHGYIAGDGGSYLESRRIRATSICPEITVALRDVCASLGYGWASIEHKKAALRHGRNEREAFTFSLCGNGVNEIAASIDKPAPDIVRPKTESLKNNAATTTEISNGYAWLRIRSIEDAGIKKVYDFEVDHDDHSYCTIHGATHNSEVAYWPHAEDHAKGILQAVPNEPATEIILESTANGIGNYFYNMWCAAESGASDFQAIFIPWYWQREYRIEDDEALALGLTDEEAEYYDLYADNGLTVEHLFWRRRKLKEFSNDHETAKELFNVEYPMTALDAFRNPVADRFIKANLVMRARKATVTSESPLVIGVDPAIGDGDRTAIIRRKGRLAYNVEKHYNLNTMELVGLIRRIIAKECPVKVYIDCIGIGAGIVDRLKEIGYDCVEGINVARSANDRDKFKNLRAELWHEMREWLAQEMPIQIPDLDELQGDLTSVGYKFDSSGRLQIESKEDLKKRGMKSPDMADALALTFYAGDYFTSVGESYNPLPERVAGMLV